MIPEPFAIEVTRRAEKDLENLGEEGAAVATRALLTLESNPTRGHTLAGALTGARSLEFSMPGGEYRAAYVVLPAERLCGVEPIAGRRRRHAPHRQRHQQHLSEHE